MTQLSTKSTFKECSEIYLKEKSMSNNKNPDIISQRTKCNTVLYPSIGDIKIIDLNYDDFISILSTLKYKNYSDRYITSCWYMIKNVISMIVELNLIKKPEFLDISSKEMLKNIDDVTEVNPSEKWIDDMMKQCDVVNTFVSTRNTSVFSYLLYLYKSNEIRNHHKIHKSTICFLIRNIDKYILNKAISEVTKYDIDRINHEISVSGYNPELIKYLMLQIRFAFISAYESGLIDSELYRYFYIPRCIKQTVFHYSDEEYKAIKNAINKSGLKNLYLVAESTGLMRSEVIALQIHLYDSVNGLLTINSRIMQNNKIIRANTQTTTWQRTIRLPEVAIEALNDELEKRERKKLAAGDKWNNDSDYIFTDKYGNCISFDTLRYDRTKIKILSGVDYFDFRYLKKNTVYHMIKNDIPLSEIKDYMGYKDISNIPVYYSNITE